MLGHVEGGTPPGDGREAYISPREAGRHGREGYPPPWYT